jgi:hypothetical protein
MDSFEIWHDDRPWHRAYAHVLRIFKFQQMYKLCPIYALNFDVLL